MVKISKEREGKLNRDRNWEVVNIKFELIAKKKQNNFDITCKEKPTHI